MPNRLIHETSPYLLQHAGNPVDWYPWGDEAFNRARQEDKPVLLSIGYSACHWCHVMAHESFENADIALLMNTRFINIKVDREERPDLDTIYMEAVQLLTGSGGWPLTVFLTPDGKPFYGGTYFPPEDIPGRPAFRRVLTAVSDLFRSRRQEVEQSTHQIVAALTPRITTGNQSDTLTNEILDRAVDDLSLEFDQIEGGFGQAPKFPQPMTLEFLLRYYQRTRHRQALEMVSLTLEKMAAGGIYDQIGGGFHRYATDQSWQVPHFEKMLYDNALLSKLYLHAYWVTRNPLFKRIAEETIDYVLREMTAPQGGFYSTQDADSAGKEGQYYLWTPGQIRQTLDGAATALICAYYGVTEEGNFEGANILHIASDRPPEDFSLIRPSRALLLREREHRMPPGRDEKILTAWNGLMLSVLAEAAGALERDDYRRAAVAGGDFLLQNMTSGDYLRRSYRDSRAVLEGYLEDYANTIEGLLNLHLATFSGKWLKTAIQLADVMVEQFWNPPEGIFYDTGKRHQELYLRPRSLYDGAAPSGSAAATTVLLKLSRLTGRQNWQDIARQSLAGASENIARYPLGHGHWLCALDLYLAPSVEIAILGPRLNPQTIDLLRVIYPASLPGAVIAALDPDDPDALSDLELLSNRPWLNKRPTVYVCQQSSCLKPVNDPDSLAELLSQNRDELPDDQSKKNAA